MGDKRSFRDHINYIKSFIYLLIYSYFFHEDKLGEKHVF